MTKRSLLLIPWAFGIASLFLFVAWQVSKSAWLAAQFASLVVAQTRAACNEGNCIQSIVNFLGQSQLNANDLVQLYYNQVQLYYHMTLLLVLVTFVSLVLVMLELMVYTKSR